MTHSSGFSGFDPTERYREHRRELDLLLVASVIDGDDLDAEEVAALLMAAALAQVLQFISPKDSTWRRLVEMGYLRSLETVAAEQQRVGRADQPPFADLLDAPTGA